MQTVTESQAAKKPRVITIHGINSKGEWQEETEKALGVFFDFDPIKYNHYRWLFGTQLLFNPFVWIPLATALGIAIHKGWLSSAWQIVLSTAVVLFIAFLCSFPYRRWAEKTVRKRLSEKFRSGGAPPNLIAHSFGTYISGRALRALSWMHFDRIVLTGCVLDENFPWAEVRTGSPVRFSEVRNEMAAQDKVARLAARLDSLIPGFGGAGYLGFKGSTAAVHNVESANSVCTLCGAATSRPLLHNVKSEELGHSDVFLGPAYAVMYWLPFMWRYDPAAYRNFLSLCFEVDHATQNKEKKKMKDYYQQLRRSSWGQTPRKILDDEIADAVPDGRKLSDAELDKIATETVRFVLLGQAALERNQTVERGKFVQFLNIFVAIDAGWRNAFPDWQS